ncbi:hypothetical protein FPOAC2_03823 [Fusarium poae]|uniref:hypothetical protein n=1 Tax=Fusarium poae TaxID=36050 RepID=UPI001CE95416|nr:hypothetical protein FPOAC1_003718 [Fusarium poae]KAG8677690.1 hypothetical protein FPOAC1_003718 [Fusarium poae]
MTLTSSINMDRIHEYDCTAWSRESPPEAPTVDGVQTIHPFHGQEQRQQHTTSVQRNAPPPRAQKKPQEDAKGLDVGWHAMCFFYWVMALITMVVMAKIYRGLFPTTCGV